MVQSVANNPFTVPGYQNVRQAWFENMQAAIVGDKSPKQARDDFQAAAQKIIDENKK